MPTPDGAGQPGGRPPVEWLSWQDLAEALDAAEAGAEDLGPLSGRPLVAVSLERAPGDPFRTAALRRLPCVVVGVGDGGSWLPPDGSGAAAGLDVLLTERIDAPRPWVSCPAGVARSLSAVEDVVSASPAAAVTLVQLLRMGENLALDQALWAESLAYSTLQGGERFRQWLGGNRPRRRAAPEHPAVVTARAGDILEITLNRPHVHNAFNTAMRDGLVEALRLAAADSTLATVHLRGAGPSFCSGGDLSEFGTAPDPATAHLVRATRSPARWLHACAGRTTAMVHGACIGAGVELAALAGRVTAAEDTTFALPEVGLGLVPGAGGTASLPRRIGRHRTAYLALCGHAIDTAIALRWGLVDRIADPATA